MRTKVSVAIVLGVATLVAARPSFAGPVDGIVFQQPPTFLGGPGSDTEFISAASGQQVWQLIADNVVLDSTADIRRITWLGFYGGSGQPHDPPDGPETMRIRFHGARPSDGLPDDDNMIFEESFLNPSRTPTGNLVNVGGFPEEFFFEVDLSDPVTLEASTLYWLEIVQVGDVDSHFRWENGFGLVDNFAFVNGNVPDWQSTIGSLAFQLSTIPEPSSGLLVCWGAMLVARRPARRRRWA